MSGAPRPPGPATSGSSAPVPDMSVLIPAWKAAGFIDRAIASALAQEGVAVEVIVADDASPDDTAEVVTALAVRDPRLRLVRAARNGGPGAARNLAADAARGRWLAVLDADDAFAPGRLARLVGVAEACGFDAVADLPRLWDRTADAPAPAQFPADGRIEALSLTALLDSAVDGPPPVPGAPRLDLGLLKPVVSRRLVSDGLWRYPDGVRHGEDFLVLFDALAAGLRFGLLHEAHYLFTTRIGALSGAWSEASVTDVDYRGVAADTHRLIARIARDRPDLPGLTPEAAVALLEGRVARLRKLNRQYGWNTLWSRAWRRHLAWLRRDPRNLGLIADEALRRLRRGRWLARRLAPSPAGAQREDGK